MRILTIGALLVLVGNLAFAAYTIDGYDSDWVSGYSSENIDGDDDPVAQYDVIVNRSDFEDDYWYFYFRTQAYYPTGNVGDFSEIYLDTDMDTSTGAPFIPGTGFDYKLRWDLGDRTAEQATGTATLYRWDSGTETFVDTGNSYAVARGLATNTGPQGNEMFTEWSLPGNAVGNPDNLRWGAYMDDYGTSADDLCPDEMDQPGQTPEFSPFTLLLVAAGAIVVLGQRRKED